MGVELNHTIVRVPDKRESAQFLAGILGLGDLRPFGPFLAVQTANNVSLDFADDYGPVGPQHYAFLVSESDFDEIFGRIRNRRLPYWADPGKRRPGEVNTNDGGSRIQRPDCHSASSSSPPSVTRKIRSGETSTSYISCRWARMSRVVMPRVMRGQASLGLRVPGRAELADVHRCVHRAAGRWRYGGRGVCCGAVTKVRRSAWPRMSVVTAAGGLHEAVRHGMDWGMLLAGPWRSSSGWHCVFDCGTCQGQAAGVPVRFTPAGGRAS